MQVEGPDDDRIDTRQASRQGLETEVAKEKPGESFSLTLICKIKVFFQKIISIARNITS